MSLMEANDELKRPWWKKLFNVQGISYVKLKEMSFRNAQCPWRVSKIVFEVPNVWHCHVLKMGSLAQQAAAVTTTPPPMTSSWALSVTGCWSCFTQSWRSLGTLFWWSLSLLWQFVSSTTLSSTLLKSGYHATFLFHLWHRHQSCFSSQLFQFWCSLLVKCLLSWNQREPGSYCQHSR